MNGAQLIISTLVANGVDVTFANPGTSEMHFVAALDSVPQMRGVLGLFEGVVTGAADGYGRIAGKPAATLLHLGPGLANGLANLHNARRARTPIVNLVGDHATYHKRFDAPSKSDIESLAHRCRDGCTAARRSTTSEPTSSAALRAAWGPPGQVATLIVPCGPLVARGGRTGRTVLDHGAAEGGVGLVHATGRARMSSRTSQRHSAHRGRAALMVGGTAPRRRGLEAASRVAAATGAKLFARRSLPCSNAAPASPPVERLGYLAEFATAQLEGVTTLVLVDARSPGLVLRLPGQAERPRARRVRSPRSRNRGRRRTRGARSPRRSRGAPREGRDPAAPEAGASPEPPTGALSRRSVADARRADPPRRGDRL